RRSLLGVVVLLPLLVVWFCIVFVGRIGWIAAPTFGALMVGIIVSQRLLPKLICPACKLDSACEPVRFCPECGSEDLKKKGEDPKYFLSWPSCKSCGNTLSVGRRGRHYRIRFCTRCGGFLDNEGF